MGKFARSLYECKNPAKYAGDASKIMYRSSWELAVMRMLDMHPSVLKWASEPYSIPYRNPLTGKQTVYIPDFMVVYDRGGKQHVEMWEVKPAKEVMGYQTGKKQSKKDQLAQVLNMAKWRAAAATCAKRGIFFRVLTEHEIFRV